VILAVWLRGTTPTCNLATTTPQLKVRLTNAGERSWLNAGGDYGHVTVRLLRPDDDPLPERPKGPWSGGYMLGAALHLLPALLPGSFIDLAPTWGAAPISSLPLGDYGVVAELNNLQLRSGPEPRQLRLR
jgi:hypothetical protein